MTDTRGIKAGMQVIGSDGGMVGTVDDVEGDRIKLKRAAELGGGGHHFVPIDWVARVDEHVHLTLDAATVRDRWDGEGAGTAAGGAYAGAAAGDAVARANWIPWVIGLAILALLLFFGLRGCDQTTRDDALGDNQAAATGDAMAAGDTTMGDTMVVAPVSGAAAYLAGTEAAPRTFAFEKLNFDTSSAEIRPADRDEVAAVAATLKAHPTTMIRVVGYADARGSDPANQTLGQRRADAVKTALVAGGVAADKIETASGGEEQPTATNATAQGQFENRRTELVIVSR